MLPFCTSDGYEYILLVVDYVSKWIEEIPRKTNDHKLVLNFIQQYILCRFGCSRTIISDEGMNFKIINFFPF